jgi:hypothetical protein
MQTVLEKAMSDYRRRHPGSDDNEMLKHIIRYKVPQTLPGSPSWHRSHLDDLLFLCQPENWGRPALFLTLTADEVSESRFPEVDGIDAVMHRMLRGEDWTWKVRTVQCN